MTYGFIKSELDGTELVFNDSQDVPEEFRYTMPKIINLGERPICTACASSAFLNWQWNKDFDLEKIFKNSKGTALGAEFKNVFNYLESELLIDYYAIVGSELSLKTAILINGPCVAGLMVKSMDSDFWNGLENYGGHAIAIVGWNKEGFIIRNSWGEDWGENGYTLIPYKDFNKFIEIWTLIK